MKKNTKRVLLLTIFFIFYYLFVTKGCKFLYGSVLDWNCQHYLIPDYFRKLFYETGKLLPNFALNLGGGQNIYNLSYYGFLSPVILISYLLPFVSMKNYIIISSILLIYFSVILFYKWISTKFDDKISFISTIIFLLSTPLLFHTHRHIMFINYMPFLILGLIGVDKYFEQNKKSLLTLSVFLIIMSSYFFSVGALVGIVIYGIYIYIKRNDKDIDLISSSSLPVGILSDIKLDRKITKVNYGDYIIMVSDGILDAGKNNNLGDNWLIYFLQKIKTTNPKEIANLILDRALEIQDGVVEDDMTVLVTKVCSN